MAFRFDIKILLFFIFFFILTYFDDRFIGGISFASIWKIPFIAYWTFYTYLLYPQDSYRFSFVVFAGIFCLLMPIHSNMFVSVIPEITDVFKYLIIPSLFYYLIRKFKERPIVIVKLLFWLSIFLIWTNIPYIFKIISPKVQKDYSSSFGEGILEEVGFSGPYMNIHSQAVFMSCALLFIIFLIYKFPKQFPIKNWFLISTLCIGIYCLFVSFARTGWLFFIVGIVIILSDNFNRQKIRKSLPLLILISICLIYLYNSNTSFQKRLTDDREYSISDNEIDQIGSGRILFGLTAIENWYESDNLISIFLGYGSDKGKDKMAEKIGLRLFAHNSFIETLQRSGIIGLLLFLLLLHRLFLFNRKFRNIFSNLLLAFLVGWVLVGAVQEFTFIYFNVMIAGIMAISYLKYEDTKKKIINKSTIDSSSRKLL